MSKFKVKLELHKNNCEGIDEYFGDEDYASKFKDDSLEESLFGEKKLMLIS